jgi:hypothetical protein
MIRCVDGSNLLRRVTRFRTEILIPPLARGERTARESASLTRNPYRSQGGFPLGLGLGLGLQAG